VRWENNIYAKIIAIDLCIARRSSDIFRQCKYNNSGKRFTLWQFLLLCGDTEVGQNMVRVCTALETW